VYISKAIRDFDAPIRRNGSTVPKLFCGRVAYNLLGLSLSLGKTAVFGAIGVG